MDRILWNKGRESVDEFIVHNCTVHLEQMSDTSYWMGIYKDGDELRRALMVNLSHRGRVPLVCTVEDDSDCMWEWAEDDEH
jgi:hypothetical protein